MLGRQKCEIGMYGTMFVERSEDIEAQMFFFAFVTALNMDPSLSPQAQVFQRKRERTQYWRFRKLNNIHQIREKIAWHRWGIFVTAVYYSQVSCLCGETLKHS